MSILQTSVEVQINIKLSIFCLTWIWQDFVIVLQNTPCPVCHPTMAYLVHWFCSTVLPDGVIQHSFYPLNNWCNFKRFTAILNMKFCWILYEKSNFWQINFSCAFVFALATKLASLQTTCQLLHVLSCLCIPVSHAVVEWFFSQVISVFKMRKSCDFECV